MSSTRRNSEKSLVPPPGNPDRKRALNVLAQRRYRERRRNKIAELEAKISEKPKSAFCTATRRSSPAFLPTDDGGLGPLLPTPNPSPLTVQQLNADNDWDDLVDTDQHAELREQGNDRLATGEEQNENVEDVVDSSINLDVGINPELLSFADEYQTLSSESDCIVDASNIDLSLQGASGLAPFNPYLSAFADDSILEMPSLKVIKAAKTVTTMLGIADELWDPSATWILDAAKFPFDVLPAHYYPTDAQLVVPHHPFIDALPWPSVRNKLIWTLAQPPQLRPPSARDPMAIMFLALDIDDDAEGVRISGSDGLDEKSWEIGQSIFKSWWWAFSRPIINNSNRLRLDRGAGPLRLQPA